MNVSKLLKQFERNRARKNIYYNLFKKHTKKTANCLDAPIILVSDQMQGRFLSPQET